MRQRIAELVAYRELLYMLTWRDIKIRYKQSVMGLLWTLLMPVLTISAGILVKSAFSFVSGKPISFTDIASVSVKALPWSFFIASTRFATTSLTSNSNLVTKIYFPREVFPLSAVLANMFDFAIASAALFVVLFIMQSGISIYLLWLPVLLGLIVMFTAAVGMFLSCANLFFRDVKYLVELVLTFAIFFTPVLYDASLFGKWASLMMLNPMAGLLEACNAVIVLHRSPDLFWLSYSAVCATAGLVGSWAVFRRLEFAFAERI